MVELKEHLAAARTYFEENNFKKAIDRYLQALKKASRSKQKAIISAELSWAFFRMNEFEHAIEAAGNVLKLDPGYESPQDVYRLLGFSYSALQKDELAVQNLKKSAQIDRTSEKQQIVLFELTKIFFKNQKYRQAEKLITEIEPYFYQNRKEYWLSILFYKGFIFYYRNQLQKSESIFEELLENARQDKRKATALFGLAFVNFSKKDYVKTINLCEAVTGADKEFFDMETLGFLTAASFYNLGRKDIFKKYYDRLKMKFPHGRYSKEMDQMKSTDKNKE